ncbi:neural-cadherin-like [Petromyzon marinus]|uniref:neural-cadherin-like n=1 Tax=Petromyzon marinus TaxID=7757 RepID=UPI003F703ACD
MALPCSNCDGGSIGRVAWAGISSSLGDVTKKRRWTMMITTMMSMMMMRRRRIVVVVMMLMTAMITSADDAIPREDLAEPRFGRLPAAQRGLGCGDLETRNRPRRATATLKLSAEVSEDARPGSPVARIPQGRFLRARFELVSEPQGHGHHHHQQQQHPWLTQLPADQTGTHPAQALAVDGATGQVVTARTLDRETEPQVSCTVRVRDSNGADWFDVELAVAVTDVNDNVPEWLMEPFPFLGVVAPDAAPGTVVYRLAARDADSGANGEVRYQLIGGGEGRFEVDAESGAVRTVGGAPLARERPFVLTVLASDAMGAQGAYASLSVSSAPRAPQFGRQAYEVAIPEGTEPNRTVLVVTARSFQGGRVSFSLLGNPAGLLAVAPRTGELSLTRAVDYESEQRRYLGVIRATEEAPSGGLSSEAQVTVIILDDNDCVPEFLHSTYSYEGLAEDAEIGTYVLQVSARDCDSGLNALLSYFVAGGGGGDFAVSPDGSVSVARALDHERSRGAYEFAVAAVDRGHPPRTGTAAVRVRVANVNDEAPRFSRSTYQALISEEAGPHALVGSVLAIDPDGDAVSYAIASGNEDGNFLIDPHEGIIRLRSSPPPRLLGPSYTLGVTATDDNASGGAGPLRGHATVSVTVRDVNNNKPHFAECARYSELAVVAENLPAGQAVVQVEAHDADEGDNGRVRYGLIQRADASPALHIHPETGLITTTRPLDREAQREHAVTVTATDQGSEPLVGVCRLAVTVADDNDNAPRFEAARYEHILREDTPVGTSFLRVAAHDEDQGANAAVTYSLSGDPPEYMRVNPATGWVYVHQPISLNPLIRRLVVATDGGNRSSSVELSVSITNLRNQPPRWHSDRYDITVPENTTRDTVILTLKASSQLGDPRVTYTLEEGGPTALFYLSPNRADGSASLLLAEPLDYEAAPRLSLRVRAQNVAAVPLAAFASVYVSVTDVNDNVPFFTAPSYEASVPEGASVGTFVTQVSATDLDSGEHGKVSYSLLKDASGDHRFFSVDEGSGAVFTRAVFDRESKSSYVVEVQSRDGTESARTGRRAQPNTDSAYVRVIISDVNDNVPTFERELYEVTLDEDVEVGTIVATLVAVDGDEGADGLLRYRIVSGNEDGAFELRAETGALAVARPLDYERAARHALRVAASDGRWEGHATVAAALRNLNDEAPVFASAEYRARIAEGLPRDAPVLLLQVSAHDPDRPSSPPPSSPSTAAAAGVRYSLRGQGAGTHFSVDAVTGELWARAPLDREERPAWRLLAVATDEGGAGLSGFADVVVAVDDVNDNAPAFVCAGGERGGEGGARSDNGEGREGARWHHRDDGDDSDGGDGRTIAGILGHGAATGGAGVGTIGLGGGGIGTGGAGGGGGNVGGSVGIAGSGKIGSVGAAGGSNVGDTGPGVNGGHLGIRGGADLGRGHLGSGTGTGIGDKGSLSRFLTAPPSADTATSSGLSGCLVGEVLENAAPGTAVMQVLAVDPDDPGAGGNAAVRYRIVGGVGDAPRLFRVDPATGTVRTAAAQGGADGTGSALDREVLGSPLLLLLEAADGGGLSATATATVAIVDVNDNAPRFLVPPGGVYRCRVPEGTQVGTVIATVSAWDGDAGDNALVSFSVEGGDVAGAGRTFSVESDRAARVGTVRLARPLDYERPRERRFNVTLAARDPDHGDRASLLVEVLDDNDNAPLFSRQLYEASPVSEAAEPGHPVAGVSASDADSGANGEVSYSLAPRGGGGDDDDGGGGGGGTAPPFDVHPHLGLVSLSGRLDRESSERHLLLVLATDGGSPPRTGTATLLVPVLDVNDNAPEPESEYRPVVFENGPAPADVPANATSLALRFVDRDGAGRNGAVASLRLAEASASAGDFALRDAGDGSAVLTALRAFDREAGERLLVAVVATDGGELPRSATATLTVTVGDRNDNPHQPGSTAIYVYKYRGALPSGELGRVFAPDPDDWDNKTFTYEGQAPRWFSLARDSGVVSLRLAPPPGEHSFRVRVADGVWPDAVSTATVLVAELPEEALVQAGSLSLADTTAEDFLYDPRDGVSRYELLRAFISSEVFGLRRRRPPPPPSSPSPAATGASVHLFAVSDAPGTPGRVDVCFAVLGAARAFRAERLNGNVAMHKARLEEVVNVSVARVGGPGPCRTPPDGTAPHPPVSRSGAVSVAVGTVAVVTDSVREDERDSGPVCRNGGIRIAPSTSSYGCECPPALDGPLCERTQRWWNASESSGPGSVSYAWFPPLRLGPTTAAAATTAASLSLEFLTGDPDGLLLYAGPLAAPGARDRRDFIAIELRKGAPTLSIDLGSGTLLLSGGAGARGLADGRWHHAEVSVSGADVIFTLDWCEGQRRDGGACEAHGIIPGEASSLDVLQPLQLGGVKPSPSFLYPGLASRSYTGCIRNVVVDGELLDMETPGEAEASGPGCSASDSACTPVPSPGGSPACGGHGECEGPTPPSLGTAQSQPACRCRPGHSGALCKRVLKPFTVAVGGTARFLLPASVAPSLRWTHLQLLLRTRARDAHVLSACSPDRSHYVSLAVCDGHACARLALPAAGGAGVVESRLTLTDPGGAGLVSDGRWHSLQLWRHGAEMTLRVDTGGRRRENRTNTRRRGGGGGGHTELQLDPAGLLLGGVGPYGNPTSFKGCVRDVRFNGLPLSLDAAPSPASGSRVPVSSPVPRISAARGISAGCVSDSCSSRPCPPPFLCVDLWHLHQCRCPAGQMLLPPANASNPIAAARAPPPPTSSSSASSPGICVPDPCSRAASPPCRNGGACLPETPTAFSCRCRHGFAGRRCEAPVAGVLLAAGAAEGGPTIPAVVAASVCAVGAFGIIVVLSILACWIRARSKRGPHHSRARGSSVGDVRENVVSYNEEGGGEDDQNLFSMAELQRPLQVLESRPTADGEGPPRFSPSSSSSPGATSSPCDGDPEGPALPSRSDAYFSVIRGRPGSGYAARSSGTTQSGEPSGNPETHFKNTELCGGRNTEPYGGNQELHGKNSDPQSQNPESYNQNPELYSQNQELHSQNMELYGMNHEAHDRNMAFYSRNPELYGGNQELHGKNPDTQSRNPESFNRNPEFYSQNQELHSRNLEPYGRNEEVHHKNIALYSRNPELHSNNQEANSKDPKQYSGNVKLHGSLELCRNAESRKPIVSLPGYGFGFDLRLPAHGGGEGGAHFLPTGETLSGNPPRFPIPGAPASEAAASNAARIITPESPSSAVLLGYGGGGCGSVSGGSGSVGSSGGGGLGGGRTAASGRPVPPAFKAQRPPPPDYSHYLARIMARAEKQPDDPPPRVYAVEGGGTPAGSLSTITSGEWGEEESDCGGGGGDGGCGGVRGCRGLDLHSTSGGSRGAVLGGEDGTRGDGARLVWVVDAVAEKT